MNDRIAKIIDAVPQGATVLDIGATQYDRNTDDVENWLHYYLEERAGRCVGIDINEGAIDDLNEKGYDMQYGDAETFELDERFDVIVAGEIMEHLPRVGDMLERVRDHLHPDGRFIASTPYPWPFVRIRQTLNGIPNVPPGHVCWYCPTTMENLLGQFGFEVREIKLTKPKQRGISLLCYKLGFEELGAPGFVTIAEPTGASIGGV